MNITSTKKIPFFVQNQQNLTKKKQNNYRIGSRSVDSKKFGVSLSRSKRICFDKLYDESQGELKMKVKDEKVWDEYGENVKNEDINKNSYENDQDLPAIFIRKHSTTTTSLTSNKPNSTINIPIFSPVKNRSTSFLFIQSKQRSYELSQKNDGQQEQNIFNHMRKNGGNNVVLRMNNDYYENLIEQIQQKKSYQVKNKLIKVTQNQQLYINDYNIYEDVPKESKLLTVSRKRLSIFGKKEINQNDKSNKPYETKQSTSQSSQSIRFLRRSQSKNKSKIRIFTEVSSNNLQVMK